MIAKNVNLKLSIGYLKHKEAFEKKAHPVEVMRNLKKQRELAWKKYQECSERENNYFEKFEAQLTEYHAEGMKLGEFANNFYDRNDAWSIQIKLLKSFDDE